MPASSALLKRLALQAGQFASDNHTRLLADVVQCIHATGDPLEGLRLLVEMDGSAFVKREEPRKALHEVGEWLGGRLWQEDIDREQVLLELGWLQRLAKIEAARTHPEKQAAPDSHRQPRARSNELPGTWKRRLERIQQRRAERAAAAARATCDSLSHAVAAPLVETAARAPATSVTLPETFAACFVAPAEARKAARDLRQRVKQRKPPKERLLELRPVEPALQGIAARLLCSTRQTAGFAELLANASEGTGQVPSFAVTALSRVSIATSDHGQAEYWLAGRIIVDAKTQHP